MGMSVGEGGGDDVLVDINTTPLIDVMLVLLIMFIITIPIQTHAVKLDTPRPNPNPPPETQKPQKHVLQVFGPAQGNMIAWDGVGVDLATLASYFDAIGAQDKSVQPEVHFRPDGDARYETVAKILAAAQQKQVRRIGFVGNEAFLDQPLQ
jgi:biopolymer transport protein ExbD